MTKPPPLYDWKTNIEDQMKTASYKEDDIIKMVYTCEDYIAELQPAISWVNSQAGFLQQILANFRTLYIIRFGKEVPPQPKKETLNEVILDSPDDRKRVVREISLAITYPGNEVSDEAILDELKKRGMKLNAHNPTATISTILHGFKTDFEKVKEKRGVFRRVIKACD